MRPWYLLAVLVVLICPQITSGQSAKENAFKTTLSAVVQKIVNRDSAGLAKYINKRTGIYLLHRIGIQDTYVHYPAIGFSDTSYPYVLYFVKVKLTPLKYGPLPQNDCEKWNKYGAWVDTTLKDQLLTKTVLSLKRNLNVQISQTDLNKITLLESVSRRVVIVNNERDSLIIYLSYINNKWMLTILDFLTGDCSV